MRHGTAVGRLVFVALAGVALVAAARAQDKDEPKNIEYLRIPLTSIFHPDTSVEARIERGLYIGTTKSSNQDWKIPVELPVGATVLEVGVVGQTSNQITVRLDREDWTPVYAFGETAPKDAGAWTCCSITEKGLTRKTAKPMPDDQNIPVPKREFEEQEFVVTVVLARSPNATKEDKAASPTQQKDKVTALWLKIGK